MFYWVGLVGNWLQVAIFISMTVMVIKFYGSYCRINTK